MEQGFADNTSDAAAMAISAGVDQDMPGSSYLHIADEVRAGRIPVEHVDRAAGNVLRKKLAARLFDAAADPSLAKEVDSPTARNLARLAAEEGSVRQCTGRLRACHSPCGWRWHGHARARAQVLLLNRDETLPLDRTSLKRVAVVGPFGDGPVAETAMLGGYSPGPPAQGVVTIAQGLVKRGGPTVTWHVGSGAGNGGPHASDADFAAAVAAAADADATIVAIGTTSCSCCRRCGNGEVWAAMRQAACSRPESSIGARCAFTRTGRRSDVSGAGRASAGAPCRGGQRLSSRR